MPPVTIEGPPTEPAVATNCHVPTAVSARVSRARANSPMSSVSVVYHKMEMCRPDIVVGIQSGGELEPLIGMLRRFFSMDVEVLPVDVHIAPASPEDRHAHRAKLFAEAFAPPLQRWRVRPTVFAPTLPAGLDLSRLNGVLVGVMDGTDSCLGLGVLEYEDDILRVQTNTGEGMRGLRLGSLRIDLITFEVKRVRLREVMFGLD